MTRPAWHAFRCPRCGAHAEQRAATGEPRVPVCQCGLDPTKPYLSGRLTPKQMTPEEGQ